MADTKKIQQCPVCSNQMMKYFIEEINANVDICAHCGGTYLDIYESQLLDKASNKAIENLSSMLELYDKKSKLCPKCNANMAKYDSFEISIDECPECGVKFFNGGELKNYLNRFKTKEEKSNFTKDILKIK